MTWAVPDWYVFLLLAAAAFRCWRLAAEDEIVDPIRDRLVPPGSTRESLVTCPWCLGAWLCVGWWMLWSWQPHWTSVIAVPFALSAVVGLLGSQINNK